MRIKRAFDHDFPTPAYQSDGAAAIDLYYAGANTIYLYPGEARWIPTGWCFEILPGMVGLVRDRSGWASSLTVRAGVIDSDYRGEIRIMLRNEMPMGEPAQAICPGDRIAQMLVLVCPQVELREVSALSSTTRGKNGFGSTGA